MLCCVCLLENSNYMDLFDVEGRQLKIAEIINKHLWFQPQPGNYLTSHICSLCWDTLNDFHTFYETAKKAHKYNRISCDIKTEVIHTESIKLEHDLADGNTQTNIENEEDCEIKNPLEEINEKELFINSTDNEELTSCDEYEAPNSSDQDSYSNGEKTSGEEEMLNDKIISTTKKKIRKKFQKKRKEVNDSKKKRKVQRLDGKHTEEMIRKHIPMGCHLCVFVGATFSDIVQHFRNDHPSIRPYIMCCDKKLSKRFFVAQHALKHEDPNCFRCQECRKSFTTICGLRNHNLSHHASTEDLIYACNECPQKFARHNLLELHKTSHIPKEQWQYICNICPNKKTFASSYLLNVHTITRHKKAVNICPVCAKEIRDKKSYEKHVRLHYEDSGPRIKCPYPDCDSWLKDEDNLKQHLTRHNPEGVVYKYNECNKECKNRRALTNHKRYAHTNATFQCEQCDKIFKRAISLREHMAHHTGETLYKCPFCTRTFNSNANMHSHKKKQHPIEWEEWRRTKHESTQKLINSKNSLNQSDETLTGLSDVYQ